MTIELKKFGAILTSRQLGKEALAAFLPNLKTLAKDEKIIINFDEIDVLSPSWADEFLTVLHKTYGDNLIIQKSPNSSVKATMEMLERANKITFTYQNR